MFISTTPFGECDPQPIELLNKAGVNYRLNPVGRRLTSAQLAEYIGDADVLIAGTEPIGQSVFDKAPNLKLIARVGIGLDSVDLNEARKRGIRVSYTPDAPSLAVAELTVGLMVDLLRGISIADRGIRVGRWQRYAGKRIANSCIGIIGVGRIGTKVIQHLTGGFPGVKILANDILPNNSFNSNPSVKWVGKDELLKNSDIVSLHVPLTPDTYHLIRRETLSIMKKGAFLINTSRGAVVNENDLLTALGNKHLSGAALDVFENEPYQGDLLSSHSCIFTCHMGSMTIDCRARMEIEAAEDACRFIGGEPILRSVPEFEYKNQRLQKCQSV